MNEDEKRGGANENHEDYQITQELKLKRQACG